MKIHTAILWSLVGLQLGVIIGLVTLMAWRATKPSEFESCMTSLGGMSLLKKVSVCSFEHRVTRPPSAR